MRTVAHAAAGISGAKHRSILCFDSASEFGAYFPIGRRAIDVAHCMLEAKVNKTRVHQQDRIFKASARRAPPWLHIVQTIED